MMSFAAGRSIVSKSSSVSMLLVTSRDEIIFTMLCEQTLVSVQKISNLYREKDTNSKACLFFACESELNSNNSRE
jgi:hypothetical protein